MASSILTLGVVLLALSVRPAHGKVMQGNIWNGWLGRLVTSRSSKEYAIVPEGCNSQKFCPIPATTVFCGIYKGGSCTKFCAATVRRRMYESRLCKFHPSSASVGRLTHRCVAACVDAARYMAPRSRQPLRAAVFTSEKYGKTSAGYQVYRYYVLRKKPRFLRDRFSIVNCWLCKISRTYCGKHCENTKEVRWYFPISK